MVVDEKLLNRIEDLSKLSFSNDEEKNLIKNLQDGVSKVSDIETFSSASDSVILNEIELEDLREDEVQPSMPREDVLKNAKSKDSLSFIVPRVVE